ncbi:glutamate receptor 2.8-like [Cynara cardunculus var. scolymus]|uniref:glutamate receptor 2.8-like n=1 Tax=Cynara cardunculus var. scolymus TaxID=59895 RepID=UPI000D63068C|nr:glutamate receptor 2.8-like [Cynara cardunculus var. scolymus]
MRNKPTYFHVSFLIIFLFLFHLNNKSNNASASETDTLVIGAITDTTSRAGKEARVAMEIMVDDFNARTGKNLTLYARNSRGNTVQAIHEATYLINTHKVEAILGLQTLEEVVSVAEVGSEAQVPTFSLFDSVPEWALDRWPFLVQASPSQFAQMKAVVAILKSCEWHRFTFIYEDINSASTQVIPHLIEAIKESGVEMSTIVKLSSLSSSSSSSLLLEELERIKTEQCRVFLVHATLEMGIRLFQNAKNMGMMERGYVWITTTLFTDLLHTVNSSTFSMMEGIVGLGSFFLDTSLQFQDFSTKFQKKFKIEQPEEDNNMPGIFAAQAYDATWIVALALSEKNTSGQKLLERVPSMSLNGNGITGEVQFVDRKPAASHIFPIINVIGKYYRELGFWSEGHGFSEVINRTTNNTSLQSLGYIFWPGRPLHTPRGWDISTNVNPLRVGVPTMAMFKKFVEVIYDSDGNFTCTGYSVELFKEMVKQLPYYLPYEFIPFNGTYDQLVEKVYLKIFDAVVGDVSVVSRRYQYAEFTHPYTETGLVMVVPVASQHGQWLFVKPFTLGMWALTVMIHIYNGFVVWLIERKHSPELEGSALHQTGILLCLAFTRMFLANGDELHSNLTRITTVVWLFAAIIIGQCYTASLTSMLTVRRLIPKVADFETLKNTNAIVGYGRGAHVVRYLEDVLHFKPSNIRSFKSPEEYARALRSGEIAAVFLEAPFTKLFLSKYCKSFMAAGPTFGDGGFAFVLQKGSPMLADFTKALLNISESGTLRHMEQRMIGSEHCVDLESIHDDYESLGLHSFWSLFLFTGATSTVALAIYVIISLRNHYWIEGRSLVTIISDVRKYFLYRRKRFSRKVSNVESPKSSSVLEMS